MHSSKGYRAVIRQFLRGVEWASPRNISILIHGHAGETNWAATELSEMASTRRLRPLRRLISPRQIFATPDTAKKDKGEARIDHDLKLRDVLAKYLYIRSYEGIEALSLKHIPGNPDAHIHGFLFELDNGHEDDSQLVEKLQRFAGPGMFQVGFFAAHRYGDPSLEAKRLEKILALGASMLSRKPNRVLGATYSRFLDDGALFNLRGKQVGPPPYNPRE